MMENRLTKKSKLLLLIAPLFFMVYTSIVDINHFNSQGNDTYIYDRYGYHVYLPSLIIYGDVRTYDYMDSAFLAKYKPVGNETDNYALYDVPNTGYKINQYPIGVAIFELPAFVIAHVVALSSPAYEADGYSTPYQAATIVSTLLFATLALYLLSIFLFRYFSWYIASISVVILSFGTNFMNYSSHEAGFSHIYLFFAYSLILLATDRWYQKANIFWALAIGGCIGLATITRPVDIWCMVIPIFWMPAVKSQQNWRFKIQYWKKNYRDIIIAIFTTLIFMIFLMIYWKHVTGHWVYYSYNENNDYFDFTRFRVFHGLFSWRKGWFIYSPLVILGFIGIFMIRKREVLSFYKNVFWIYYIPMIFIVFSWHNWFYGWGYGARAMIGSLPLLGIPIAVFSEKVFAFRQKIIPVLYLIVVTLLIIINLKQSRQYRLGLLHGTSMNKAVYWEIFLEEQRTPRADSLLEEQAKWDHENHEF